MTLSNNTQRILFGVIAGPLVLWLLWLGSWPRELLFSVFLAGAMWEYLRILRHKYPAIGVETEMVLPVIVGFLAWISPSGPLARLNYSLDLALVLTVAWILLQAFRRLERDDVFPWVAMAVSGLLYFGVWGSSLFALCTGRGGGWGPLAQLLFAIGVCWIGDSAAYFAGRAFGKHKLCPELSPGKTIEGAVAAVIATSAFGAWMVPAHLDGTIWMGVGIGAILGVAAILGDLLESVLKRWAGVKDSSKLFPGHGGILDRLDSLFLVAPLLMAILHSFRHGIMR
ncbi:MAG: phosphatidate cytidylyltransferase [Fibrobacterota bacterium]|nr:phosphatidate cytidylyltransferase [Fibrobacterota bacterium]QQS07417.1 MAG: phosphatidate cytidylyltransferase [Fibrobacterota bacterium]